MSYKLTVQLIQQSGDHVDNTTLSEEVSEDENTHLLKTKVFVDVFSRALNEATQTLIDQALSNGGGKNAPGK
jgi:serine/threonine protein phosphatase PrpC